MCVSVCARVRACVCVCVCVFTDVFNEQSFKNAFSVVLAHAMYLPSASCFALMPIASQLGRTGSEAGCQLDYDPERKAVVVTTPRLLK